MDQTLVQRAWTVVKIQLDSHMYRYCPFNQSCEIKNVHGVQSAFMKAGEAISIKTVVAL